MTPFSTAKFNMLEEMYDLSKMAADVDSVPAAWVYKTYYKIIAEDKKKYEPTFKTEINQAFDGRIIKMRSLVNRDSNPSLCFYVKNEKYLWYDYSAQKGGDASYFVSYHAELSKSDADAMILRDYDEWLKAGGDTDIYEEEIINVKPQFIEQPCQYDGDDYAFWRSFKITSDILRDYQIRRLAGYVIQRGEQIRSFKGRFYGYYSKQYGLYQIYSPHNRQFKYLNVNNNYLIGEDQLTFKPDVCVIVSGLKDLMALRTLPLNIDIVAGRSESILIPGDKMAFLKRRYPSVVTMLDNDLTGVKAMQLYEKVYKIPFIRVDLEKDLADNNRVRPPEELLRIYAFDINKKTQRWVNL